MVIKAQAEPPVQEVGLEFRVHPSAGMAGMCDCAPAPRLLRLPASGQENHRASHASAGASFCSEVGNLKCFKIKTNSGLLYNSVKTLQKM